MPTVFLCLNVSKTDFFCASCGAQTARWHREEVTSDCQLVGSWLEWDVQMGKYQAWRHCEDHCEGFRCRPEGQDIGRVWDRRVVRIQAARLCALIQVPVVRKTKVQKSKGIFGAPDVLGTMGHAWRWPRASWAWVAGASRELVSVHGVVTFMDCELVCAALDHLSSIQWNPASGGGLGTGVMLRAFVWHLLVDCMHWACDLRVP